ncbi:hypothetical protein ACWGID_15320 [Kribbella sp. NPDC054772]
MRAQNGRLVAVVAAVAVAAIAGGGALASRQGPQPAAAADAGPLTSSPSPAASTPSATSSAPKPTPTTPSKTTPSGPAKTKIDLQKLTTGRAPQVTYLSGRTIRGGAGNDVTIPGNADIQEVARRGTFALAIVTKGTGTEMLTLDSEGKITRRTPDITQIVTTEDDLSASYVGSRLKDTGEATAGATLYSEQDSVDGVKKVTVPGLWNTTLLGYTDGKVYFDASTTQEGTKSTLYEWTPGESKVVELSGVPKATAVSSAGTAGSLTTLANQNSCSSLLAVPSGKRLWRTCDYQIAGFTPDGATVIAGPMYEDGYGNGIATVLDAKSGSLLHEWTGVFRQWVPEDDQHLLLLADDGEGTPASIVRCTISTGACELATPLAKGALLIGA